MTAGARPWRGPLLATMLSSQGDHPWPGAVPESADIESIAAALRIAARTSRCPGYVRESIEAFDARPSTDSERAVFEAATVYDLFSGPAYVGNALMGWPDARIEREVARRGQA